MSSDWPLTTLQKAGITLIDCDHKTPKAQSSGFPYIGIPQLKNGRIEIRGARLISKEDFDHWRRKAKPKANDVILSRRCNPGESAYVPEGMEIALGQNLVILRSDGTKVYPPFLRWLAQGPQWWSQVNQFRNVGAVFDSLKCAEIPKFEVRLPPIESQKIVSNILQSLDSKIEINQQINQTLEQMAQTFFKSWFVDFEPVKAKISALEAGGSEEDALLAAMQAISGKDAAQLAQLQAEHPDQYTELRTTAELFPSAMQDSELGEIPTGWNLSQIGDEVIVVGGGTPSTKNPAFWENGHIHWSSPRDMSNLRDKVLTDTERKITDAGVAKISSGLLPVNTVLMSSRAPVGYLALTKVPTAINQGYIALKCESALSPEFALQWCSANMNEIKSRASGTTFAEISKKNFKIIPVVVPSEDVIWEYSKHARRIYSQIENNVKETESLTNIRDTLLPKLLSGSLSIPSTEAENK
ncbi:MULTISPECIES: restriction endonuclease subunit S [Pseudidiomarina]|uniref:Type I restriction enzyme S subunit n=2 Tax=Pseudidiomarina TaxID=2800384 RepID=A0A368UNS4_9GAMM|nr:MULTISPECIES: restriction endonuclease subunit S [Pseudidiomarina]PWW11213.1 type I restriction enzyme S subunit [Pseudidiomarina maritima]RBP88487.1 type I restriction enzyme S subunit [Pseudidiomarina tainanensis]RCW30439.1 type I restriction enzyme S subunit [Pseudidiomarina tainanensis]